MNAVSIENGYPKELIHMVINFNTLDRTNRSKPGKNFFAQPYGGQTNFIIQKLFKKLDPKINAAFSNLSSLNESIFSKIKGLLSPPRP